MPGLPTSFITLERVWDLRFWVSDVLAGFARLRFGQGVRFWVAGSLRRIFNLSGWGFFEVATKPSVSGLWDASHCLRI